jgi:hypothetical protein
MNYTESTQLFIQLKDIVIMIIIAQGRFVQEDNRRLLLIG